VFLQLRESQLLKLIESNSHSNHNTAQPLAPVNHAHSLELENAALHQRVTLLQEQLTKSEHHVQQSTASLQQSELQIVTLQSTAQQSQRDIAALKQALEQETLRCQAAAQSVNDISVKLKQSEDQMKLKLEEMAELRRQAREAHSETRSMEQQLSSTLFSLNEFTHDVVNDFLYSAALKRTKDLCAALMDARELCEAQAESVRQARDRADECEQQIGLGYVDESFCYVACLSIQ
jgi:chromosome segregation ATPase